MAQRWVIGLAAGSGGLGTDAALLEIEGVGLGLRVSQLTGLHAPHAADLRDAIRRAADPRALARLHRLMGETFAAAARAVADSAGLPLARVQAIGCRGIVLGHDPEGRFPAVLPVGMAAVLAERTGITTLSDLLCRDIAAGGAGVPLMALPAHLLFRHPTKTRLIVHLGGMARIVWLPAGGRPGEMAGFEAGPCGVLLDALVRQLTGGKEGCDAGGKHAVQGRCLPSLVKSWLAHPLLSHRPPRSLPRHAFADEFARQALEQLKQTPGSLHDLLCTASHFVVRCIAEGVRRHLPSSPAIDEVLLTGWGVRNGLLWRLLEQQMEGVRVGRADEAGVPAELHQAAVAGLLAALTVDGVPGNSPAATGAAGSRLLGSLTPGSMANWTRCLHWMAQHAGPTPVE